MTDPATIMLIATVVGGYSAIEQGKAASQQAKASAAWQAYNAKVAQREAEAERQAAQFETKQQARQAKTLQARLRAAVGATGVEMVGSPLLVAEDTAAQLALEAANIRVGGERRVQRWVSQSILDTAKAGASRASAAGFKRAGILQAGGSLLGGAAKIGFMRSLTGTTGTSATRSRTFAWSGYGSTSRTTFGGL